MESLKKIQAELKAPKNQFNKFGNYAYRSAEDILEAVKPLLAKYNSMLTISDEIIEVGGRIYVKAQCTFMDDKGSSIITAAYAREPESKKGMDESQITGAASSYARKYALNGMFLIDDNKDADTNAYQSVNNPPPPKQEKPKMITNEQGCQIEDLVFKTKTDKAKMLEYFKVKRLQDMTFETANNCIDMLLKKVK
jgi:hypothetical protein